MPNGVPTPMQPSGPGSSQRVADSPTRAKLRKSPPSATTIASSPMRSCSAASRRLGWMRPSRIGRRGAHRRARASRRAPRGARAGRAPIRVERRRPRRPRSCTIASSAARAVGEDLDRAAPVVAQLARAIAPMRSDARRAEHRRRAVRELEIEAPPERDHEVGLAHDRAAHRGDHRRMRRPARGRGSRRCRGTARRRGRAARASAAPARRAPRPVISSGRRADHSRSIAAATCAGSGASARRGRRPQLLVAAAARAARSARSMSVGKSTIHRARLAAVPALGARDRLVERRAARASARAPCARSA